MMLTLHDAYQKLSLVCFYRINLSAFMYNTHDQCRHESFVSSLSGLLDILFVRVPNKRREKLV